MIDLQLLCTIEVRAARPDDSRPVPTQPKRVALLVYLALGDAAVVTRGEAWVGLDFDALRCDAI